MPNNLKLNIVVTIAVGPFTVYSKAQGKKLKPNTRLARFVIMKKKSFELFQSHGSLTVRIGAIIFGIGTLIYLTLQVNISDNNLSIYP
jgi:hypothetical protein